MEIVVDGGDATDLNTGSGAGGGESQLTAVAKCLERAAERAAAGNFRAPNGSAHPWFQELSDAYTEYLNLYGSSGGTNTDTTALSAWVEEFKKRTVYWCAQVLDGAVPFPPKLRSRIQDAAALMKRLPGHN